MSKSLLLSLDQGTTSSRALVFDNQGAVKGLAQKEISQIYPSPGAVEHDAEEIWHSQLTVAQQALAAVDAPVSDIAAIGITNQRETTVLWEKSSATPVAPAIVWQSRVSAPICQRLRQDGLEDLIRQRTGLVVDAYFSATKIMHLFEKDPELYRRAQQGEILFGTIDTWLLFKLTGGRVHATDVTNASRTMMFDIHQLQWDDELLSQFKIPREILPEVRSCSEVFGHTDADLFGVEIPIAGVAGDQQSALVGQACFEKGMVKNTYGTGCFMLLNTGAEPQESTNRLLTTVGYQIGDDIAYCLEGSVFIAGAVVQWLRDGLHAIHSSAEIESLAGAVPDSGGVVVVPAFVGMGAPYWDSDARGAIYGLTRESTIEHIARAAVESMAFQSWDVLQAMLQDAGHELRTLRVDGGASVNDSLMQFQADLLGVPVERPETTETTAAGAAFLAGLAVGVWKDKSEIGQAWRLQRRFDPMVDEADRQRRSKRWKAAVERTLNWERDAT